MPPDHARSSGDPPRSRADLPAEVDPGHTLIPPPPRTYAARLLAAAASPAGLVALGLDPVLERIPQHASRRRDTLERFCLEVLDGLQAAELRPGAVKPNIAFFAQYGSEGLQGLQRICRELRSRGYPIILDAKRGDIGSTAAAYAREAFAIYQADAVTVTPYLGEEALLPFLAQEYADRAIYVLCRTTNPGAGEIQLWGPPHQPLYLTVARLILRLAQDHPCRVGAVLGATAPDALAEVASRMTQAGPAIPLLIPGIGPQGGSLAAVSSALDSNGLEGVHRLAVSRLILYAHESRPGLGVGRAAAEAMAQLLEAVPSLAAR